MSPQEAQGFAASFVLDPVAFQGEWRKRTAALPHIPSGYTPPRVEALSADGLAHEAQLRRHPNFAAIYPAVDFKMVELGKLLAYQHWMDTDVSDGVHGAGAGPAPTEAEILPRCLPLDIIPTSHMLWQASGHPDRTSVSIYSHNNTLGFDVGIDQATSQVRLVVRAGANLMMAQEHAGRFVLANGYHRAWWLRSKGVEMVPLAVMRVSADQLNRPGYVPLGILLGNTPPTIDHFLDDAVSATVDVRAMLRVVRVTAETLLVPRLL
jgi:hypothetical protein